MTHFFLGIDIGATKSHALIADETGQAAGFGQGGPGNHEVVGYAGLEATLQAITQEALREAGISREQIVGAGFGVAGYDWPSELPPTLAAIRTLGLSAPQEVVNDTVIGLVAGAEAGWGIAVVAGTSNNCWGWDEHHRIGRMMGNGSAFGENAGSGELVWRAIQAVAKAWTMRGPKTALTGAFIRLTGARSEADLLEGLSQDLYSIGPSAAPLVFETARAGDPVAIDVIRWAGEELGSLVAGVARQLGFEDRSFEVVLVGSMWQGGPLLLDPMAATVHAVAPRARFVRLTVPSVVGAVLLGMQAAGVPAQARRPRLIASTETLLAELEAVRHVPLLADETVDGFDSALGGVQPPSNSPLRGGRTRHLPIPPTVPMIGETTLWPNLVYNTSKESCPCHTEMLSSPVETAAKRST